MQRSSDRMLAGSQIRKPTPRKVNCCKTSCDQWFLAKALIARIKSIAQTHDAPHDIGLQDAVPRGPSAAVVARPCACP
jgi:hypothetical protein